ncbi:VanZ family protein [Streptomyces sp. S6]
MIEASISAVPGLVATFLVSGALLAVPVAFLMKSRGKPWRLSVTFSAYVAGILSVTLLPGNAGLEAAQCDVGAPVHILTDTSSLLNIALFAPGALLAVLVFRRPATAVASFVCLSVGVELIQAMTNLGRSCSVSDVAANATGSVIGAFAGVLWLRFRRRTPRRPARDLLWGVSVLAVGAAFTVFFQTRIDHVDIVAMDDARQARGQTAEEAIVWITDAATATFGAGTRILGSAAETSGKRVKVTADTDRGDIVGWWPEKHLEQARAKNNRADDGDVGQDEAAAHAERFARTWFPDSVKDSRRQIRTLGETPGQTYLVTYRRYRDGVMMPMRLNITVTPAKRITGFTARHTADPQLPTVTIDEPQARSIAHGQPEGRAPGPALLLAQKVGGVWRPVWLIGSAEQGVAVDAVTGRRVTG